MHGREVWNSHNCTTHNICERWRVLMSCFVKWLGVCVEEGGGGGAGKAVVSLFPLLVVFTSSASTLDFSLFTIHKCTCCTVYNACMDKLLFIKMHLHH